MPPKLPGSIYANIFITAQAQSTFRINVLANSFSFNIFEPTARFTIPMRNNLLNGLVLLFLRDAICNIKACLLMPVTNHSQAKNKRQKRFHHQQGINDLISPQHEICSLKKT